ncbi:amino acid adenylation domain-containing protein [Bacillus sp. 166amftsu]|nr:amino acid adenylation domain-containing protein [Bacillus sp. 166amftsu]
MNDIFQMSASKAQQRLWYFEQKYAKTQLYHVPLEFEMSGAFHENAFKEAIKTLVKRHEPLRTSLKEINGEVVQFIHEDIEIHGESREFSQLEFSEKVYSDEYNEIFLPVFDFHTAPLFRWKVIHFKNNVHRVIFVFHHIIVDGWSLELFLKELSQAYNAYSKGTCYQPDEIEVQYADFAEWQVEWLNNGERERVKEFWDGMFADGYEKTDIDYPANDKSLINFSGGYHELKVDHKTKEQMNNFIQKNGASLFSVLLTTYIGTLSYFSGENEIVLETVGSGRVSSDLMNMMGFFANVLPLKIKAGSKSFNDLVQEVHQLSQKLNENQSLPYEEIVNHFASSEYIEDYSPFSDFMFLFQDTSISENLFNDSICKLHKTYGPLAKKDMTIIVDKDNDGLSIGLEYSLQKYDRKFAETFLSTFFILLNRYLRKPDAEIVNISPYSLSDFDSHYEKINPVRETDSIFNAHAMLEGAILKHSQLVFTKYKGVNYTYSDLSEQADLILGELISKGIAPGSKIAIITDREPAFISSVLGCWRNDCTYIPLDLSLPSERMQQILNAANCSCIIYNSEKIELDSLNLKHEKIIDLNCEFDHNVLVKRKIAKNPAYVLFTSGSTGVPKGVIISQNALGNYLDHCVNNYCINDNRLAVVHTSLSFDLTITSVFPQLINGGRVEFIEVRQGLDGFVSYIQNVKEPLLLKCTPAHLEILFESIDSQTLASKKICVVAGGENINDDLIRKFKRLLPLSKLINEYGPTEATVGSNICELTLDSSYANKTSIGQSIKGMFTYVLNKYNMVLPPYTIGEIILSGTGLAEEYLNDGKLTDSKFIKEGFLGKRIYKTGDYGFYDDNGNVYYVGRKDSQIKIRGYRIQKEEIEKNIGTLINHAFVTVLGVKSTSDRLELCAFYKNSVEINVQSVKQHLEDKLPSYMIPAYFIRVDEIPINRNGKVEEKKLEEIFLQKRKELNTASNMQVFYGIDKEISAVWSDILGRADINHKMNFFEVGGNSILAAQLVNKINEKFKVNLTLKELFEAPVFEQFSNIVKSSHTRDESILDEQSLLENLPSMGQERLWLLDQLEPNNPFYNIVFTMKISGKLNIDRLTSSLNTIVNRHTVFGYAFKQSDEGNVIIEENTVELHIDQERVQPDCDVNQYIEDVSREFGNIPFDLSHSPLLRTKLLQVNERENYLTFSIHHTVCDGWSMGVLLEELKHFYEEDSNTSIQVDEIKYPYKVYSNLQRKRIEKSSIQSKLDWWKSKFPEELPVLKMPTSFPRPKEMSFKGKHVLFSSGKDIFKAVKRKAQYLKTTEFNILFAAYSLMLQKYSRQEEFVIGVPFANRENVYFEKLIGYFVNVLPIPIKFDESMSFHKLIENIQRDFLNVYENQDVPMELLLQEYNDSRDLSRTPLFQTLFTLQNAPLSEMRMGELELEPIFIENYTSKFDLSLIAEEKNEEFQFNLEYCTDLFHANFIERFIENFQNMLRIICMEDIKLDDIDIISEKEKQFLLHDFNNNKLEFPFNQSINEIIDQWAMRVPNKVAFSDDNGTITYAELKYETDLLSRSFVQPEDTPTPVLIYMDRSIDFVKTILSIWKAGRSYIPLEVNYPAERIKDIIRQSETDTIAVNNLSLSSLPLMEEINRMVNINETIHVPNIEPVRKLKMNDLAYIIFTSGSTGKPKGAMIEQIGMLNHLFAKIHDFKISNQDRIVENASQCFDISVWQFFSTVLVGGYCHIVSDDTAKNSRELLQQVLEKNITILEVVPTLLRFILDDLDSLSILKTCDQLRMLVVTGETLPPDLVNRWHHNFGNIPIVNAYGPTECSDDVTHYWSEEKFEDIVSHVPVGKPVANMNLYVLDNNMKLLPRGVPGELYVSGIGVGRGYINAPLETKKAFLDNPFNGEKNRFYKTGDLVRINEDGDLEFLSRLDFQVKVRGYRIELNEIENVLLNNEKINNCLVVGFEGDSGEANLALYYSCNNLVSNEEVKAYLSSYLPSYMIPVVMIEVEEFPINKNGKIDRKLLPKPILKEEILDKNFSDTEEKLASIWKELVGRDVGRTSEFFGLGGHSLLAVQMLNKLENTFNKKITLRQIFENPILKDLAQVIDRSEKLQVSVPGLQKFEHNNHPILSYSQERMAFYEYVNQNTTMFNIPGVFNIKGNLIKEDLKNAINTMVSKFDVLRTTLSFENGDPKIHIADEMHVELDYVEQNDPVEISNLISLKTKYVFDLENGPLMKFTLIKREKDDFVLIALFSHLIADGWSINLIIKEVMCNLLEKEQKLTLDEYKINSSLQYYDYAKWQKDMYESGKFQPQLDYWEQKLGDNPESTLLESSFDHNREVNTSSILLKQDINPRIMTDLYKLSQEKRVSLFNILLANFFHLVRLLTKNEDLTIGIPIAGRERSEFEDMIGCFINTLPIKISVNEEVSFQSILTMVEESVTEAIENSSIPFEKIVERILPDRTFGESPLFSLFFNMLAFPDLKKSEVLSKGNLAIEESEFVPEIDSKFDVTFYVQEKKNQLTIFSVFDGNKFTENRAKLISQQYFNLLVNNIENTLNASLSSQEQVLNYTDMLDKKFEVPLFEKFNRVAREYPNQIAIKSHGQSYSYQYCYDLKEKITSYLKMKLKPNERVAIYSNRNKYLPIICLAAMESRNPFIILDSEHPQELLTKKISIANPKLLINCCDHQIESSEVNIQHIDEIINNSYSRDKESLDYEICFDTACYINFTSGTTGDPKAIQGNHGALTHFVNWYIEEFDFGLGTSFSMLSGLSHDPIYRDMFTPLCSGGVLCVPDGMNLLDADNIIQWLMKEKINVVHTTPSYCKLIFSDKQTYRDLDFIFTGGESLNRSVYEKIKQNNSTTRIFSFYGCTETPQGIMLKELAHNTLNFRGLGKAIPGVLPIIVNDKSMRICSSGEIGEICIISNYITDGYLNYDSVDNYQVFTFDDTHSIPLFRTGDMGWMNEENEIIYIGRSDRQVKIRGNRVELGEIESLIAESEFVARCVCIADCEDDKSIYAFVVSSEDESMVKSNIQTRLAKSCPLYMLPNQIIMIDEIPLTSNKKIDQKKLMNLVTQTRNELELEVEEDLNEIDFVLVDIWEELLGRKPKLNSDFFELGGNSLKAVQLVSRIEEQFGLKVSIENLFVNRRLKQMSRLIESDLITFIESLSEEEAILYLEKING